MRILSSTLFRQPQQCSRATRRGTSLTEVLIAILILSIGVSSVIALFPLSILSSIKATQLTNAKMMDGNIEQLVRINPGYLTMNGPVSGTFSNMSGNGWQSGHNYAPGDLVVPQPKHGSTLSEPFRVFRAIPVEWDPADFAGTVASATSGVSGPTEPNWSLSSYTLDGTNYYQVALDRVIQINPSLLRVIIWEPVDLGGLANSIDNTILPFNSWVVDPLGAVTFGADGTAPAGEFGSYCPDTSGTTGNSVTTQSGTYGWTRGLPRRNAGLTNLTNARQLAAHGDAWSEVARIQPTNVTVGATTVLDLPPGTQVTTNNTRLVIRNEDGTRSVTRDTLLYTAGSPPTLAFTPNLPASFTTLGQISVEAFDSRYTWIATVNNSVPGTPVIKLVVLFKRKFLPGEEHVYRAVYGNGTGTFDATQGSLDQSAWPGGIAPDQIFIAWNPLAEPRPLIQEGKYIMEPNPTGAGVQWYKIVNVQINEASLTNPHASALITVDRQVTNRTPDTGVVGRAILMRGIVEVFDQ